MKNFILSVLLVILGWEVMTLILMNQKKDDKVLAEKTIATSSPTPTAFPTPTATPKPTPPPIPAPTPQPQFTSEQINGFIDQYSAVYGVDPNVIRRLAICESGFYQYAVNYVYSGLFQFGPITWQNLRVKMGVDPNPYLRNNALEAVRTATYAVSIGKIKIWPNCQP